MDHRRASWVDQTLRGLVLLTIGVILGALPIVRTAGIFVGFAGIVLMLEGRHIFGQRNANHIVAGSVLFVVSLSLLLVALVGYIFLFYSLNFLHPSDSFLPHAMVGLVPSFLSVDLAGSVIIALSYAVLTFHVQNSKGRAVLLLGVGVNLITSILIFSILSSVYVNELAPVWDRSSYSLLVALDFQRQVLSLSLLNILPAAVFAVAFYQAYSRIDQGQIATS